MPEQWKKLKAKQLKDLLKAGKITPERYQQEIKKLTGNVKQLSDLDRKLVDEINAARENGDSGLGVANETLTSEEVAASLRTFSEDRCDYCTYSPSLGHSRGCPLDSNRS